MEEAERLCDRIGIIDQGELKAEGTARQRTASIGEREVLRIDVVGSVDGVAKQLGATEGVASVTAREGGFDVLADDASALVAHAVTLITDRKSVVSGKSVSVRVDIRGRRLIKKKKKNNYHIRMIIIIGYNT